jgi:ankyrin repeat protein
VKLHLKELISTLAIPLFLYSSIAWAGAYDDLITAANRDDTAAVIALLQRGMDVNTVDAQGNTLLMIAARERNKPLLEYLLTNKANILKINRFGDSAVLLAALGGNLEAVKLLVQFKAEINPQGWTPLMYAAFNGHLAVANYLTEAGAKVDAQTGSGLTALMVAAKYGHFEIVSLLLKSHADAQKKDQFGLTAMDHAIKGGNTRIAESLESYLGEDGHRSAVAQ